MRTGALLGLLWLAALVPAVHAQKGASPYETIIKDMLEATDKMTAVLAAIKDAASAADARPELKKAVARFLEVRKKAEEFKEPDLKERERISQYRKRLAEAVERFLRERSRVAAIPGGREALQEVSALDPADFKTGNRAKKK